MRTDTEKLEAREGDVLVVSYGEVKIPLMTHRFGSLAVGGLIYTRQLAVGDDVETEYDRTYAFLKRLAERDAREKLRAWTEELLAARRMTEQMNRADLPPKPETYR